MSAVSLLLPLHVRRSPSHGRCSLPCDCRRVREVEGRGEGGREEAGRGMRDRRVGIKEMQACN